MNACGSATDSSRGVAPELLGRVSVALIEPSHPGNIGAVARAIKTMGLSDLRLIRPRVADPAVAPEAIALSSGADDVLRAARLFDSLEDAVADCNLCVGVSAAGREFAPPTLTPEVAVGEAIDELMSDSAARVAFVFGTERVGLSNVDAVKCQRMLSIPGNPGFSSLNLAQAVQIVAYCLRRAALEATAAPADPAGVYEPGEDTDAAVPAARYADQRAIEGFFDHLGEALVSIGYLDPRHPKKLMPRLRRLFSRTRLELEEVDLLRGICKLMIGRR